ncbi:DUF1800 domain-containing protein [Brevundimonas sp.]
MPQTDPRLEAALALTRFGMGAGPGEIETVAADPRGWLEAQARPSGATQPEGAFASTAERVGDFLAYRQAGRQRRAQTPEAQQAFDARRDSRRALTQQTGQAFLARAAHGATTPDGFAERWALFWANVFTASATKFQSGIFLESYEREAVRPHVFGRFEALALAAEQHPAMLLYLDQAQSIGPNSRAGQRRQAGLNENLAREILELHTVGSDGGYSQADVTEFARALTGWSLPQPSDRDGGAFVFRPVVHEPGERTVLGRTYGQPGRAQGEAILRDLSNRPETARRLSRKIAAHFVADEPPPALVQRLEQAWTGSGGDLAAVAKALVTAPEAWSPQPAKVKTPYEFVISAHRAFGGAPQRLEPLRQALIAMGQPMWAAPSPEGWPDTAGDWAGPDALVKRLDWARGVGELAQGQDPNAVAAGALGPRLGDRSKTAIARAESRPEAITLFLMSPEFQRR